GYHFLITNQFPFYADLKENKPKLDWDGKIQIGRPMEKIGAGVKDDNKTSLHICLVGEKYFTEKQLQNASQLCLYLALKFGLSLGTDILGHYEYWTSKGLEALKSCPNIRMPDFRKMLKMVELDPTFKI
ncbi:MAG: peptidoglycan recognition family protein, partial [Patescibacteria group bacterium]